MKYNQFRYNEGIYNGSLTYANPGIQWMVKIDWDGSGAWSHASDEGARCRGLSIQRGRDYYIQLSGDGFEIMRDGSASVTLDNYDGRFDAFNASSALYPNVEPGKHIKIAARLPYGEATYNLFAGMIYDIDADDNSGDRKVTLSCVDGWRHLRDRSISIATKQSYAIADAITDTLDAVSLPAFWTKNIGESGNSYLDFWYEDERQAADIINEIAQFDFGYFFQSGGGVMTYYPHTKSLNNLGTLSQSELLWNINLPKPWEVRRNIINVPTNPLYIASGNEVVCYTYSGDKISIDPLSSISLHIQFTYNGSEAAVMNVVTPESTTDIKANSTKNGNGTDLTSYITASLTTYGVTGELTLENTSTATAFITLLQVRAIPVVTGSITKAQASGGSYATQPKSFMFSNKFVTTMSLATEKAQRILEILTDGAHYPTVQLEGTDKKQFQCDLFDVYTLNIPKKSIVGDYAIAYIAHEWLSENGQAVRTTLKFEPYDAYSGYWIFPTTIGTTSIYGY
jgi:hypothetical protein